MFFRDNLLKKLARPALKKAALLALQIAGFGSACYYMVFSTSKLARLMRYKLSS